MNHSLQEWPDSKAQHHQAVRRRKPKHVHQEVSGQFFIGCVVVGIDGERSKKDQEEHSDGQHQKHLRGEVETERCLKGAEAQECEELDIVHDHEFEQDPPKAVRSEVCTNLVVKEYIKDFVEDENTKDGQRDKK